jgi:hypothetical protein
MKRGLALSLFVLIAITTTAFSANHTKLFGSWKGIKMFQDEESYDGRTFFLPNEGEITLDENSIHAYYYPYFKSSEYKVTYTDQSIFYSINDKQIRCDYSFSHDTLMFKMYYINKVFIKLFTRVDLNELILADLNKYGFRTYNLTYEFELDTLNLLQREGFTNYDSLGFVPFHHLSFKGDNTLIIDKQYNVSFDREFKKIKFSYNGVPHEIKISHLERTQDIFLTPSTQCQCDSIVLPYMSVEWANRMRQAIIDEENY